MTPKEFYLKLGFPPRSDKFEKSSKIFDYNDMIDFASQYHSQFEKKVDELIEKLNERNSVYKAVIKEKKLTSYPLSIFYRDIQLTKDFISDLKTFKTE